MTIDLLDELVVFLIDISVKTLLQATLNFHLFLVICWPLYVLEGTTPYTTLPLLCHDQKVPALTKGVNSQSDSREK